MSSSIALPSQPWHNKFSVAINTGTALFVIRKFRQPITASRISKYLTLSLGVAKLCSWHLHPFCRFAGIHVSIQLWAKTQGWVTLGENLGKKGLTAVNLN